MDVNGSTISGAGFASAWLQILRAGLHVAFFRDPAGFRIRFSRNHLIAVAAISLAVSAACSLVLAGPGAVLNIAALPSELLWVPLALLAGHLIGHVMKDDAYVLVVAIAVGSTGVVFTIASSAVWFTAAHGWFRVPVMLGLPGIYQVLFGWWALALLIAIRRLTFRLPHSRISPVLIVAIVVLLPAYFLPAEPLWGTDSDADDASGEAGRGQSFSEAALYAQSQLLRTAEQRIKPERAGIEDLYFVGFAPYASQDVFMKETLAVGKLLEDRFDTGGRTIMLISHPRVIDQFPIATLTSLRRALRAVGERINPDEDVVLLHVTSHGSENQELSVEFHPLALQAIGPADLRAALDDAGIKWRIVVISACYSGGFIDALKDTHTLVVTASDAKHTSFGCGDAYDFTYFSKAFFDEALRRTYSFEKAFTMARQSISAREHKEGLEPSHPQIALGDAMRAKLASLEKRLSAGTANDK